MFEEYKKVIIISSIGIVIVALLGVFMFIDIKIGPIKISSIKTILKQYDRVTNAETQLSMKQIAYKSSLTNLENEKNNFKNEKSKYESISEETIKIIKEANTTQEYSIEYMWIKLGNYAKRNNLSIILIEPGGLEDTTKSPTTDNKTNNTTTTTSGTQSSTDVNKTSTEQINETPVQQPISSTGGNFKIQVSGNYMNISDFIFAVENDSELKFKLDNLSMEYVSGTTVKTTFDVKNMVIKK